MKAVEQQTVLDQDISTDGHLVVPKSIGYVNIINKHRRAGSNGTTGDESCTTDEEELPEDTDKNKEETNGMFEYEEEFGKFGEEPFREKRKIVPYIDTDETDCAIPRNNNENLKTDCCNLNGVYKNGFGYCEKEVDLSRRVPELREHADDDLELGCKHHQTLANGAGTVNGNSDDGTWGRSVVEVKEATFARLQNELRDAHQELKLRDEEVERLSRIRQDVEAELEDLTASLFQEAHNMVREANMRQAAAEKALKESQMQVDVLTAEVAALKTLVLTSTPSRPNPHLHPQISREDSDSFASSQSENEWSPKMFGWMLPKWMHCVIPGVTLFNKKHRRSPSHFNLKYGRENSPPDSPVKEHHGSPMSVGAEVVEPKDGLEVDPVVHKEFLTWKLNPNLDKTDPFISRIYDEDIRLCLAFNSTELSERVLAAAESGTIFIEAVSDKTKTMFPKRCALLEVPRQCFYRMKLGDQDTWYSISQICRNRITAVCNFLNYLRYIERGLVKSSVHDIYWEIARLRKEMILARLGLASNS